MPAGKPRHAGGQAEAGGASVEVALEATLTQAFTGRPVRITRHSDRAVEVVQDLPVAVIKPVKPRGAVKADLFQMGKEQADLRCGRAARPTHRAADPH
jgi:hypothetical protein